MKDAPAFDFFPERWLAATADMSDAEYRQYLTLLCHSWLRDGLQKNERDLKQICGKKVSPKVREKFADFGDGKLRNPFLEEVREKQRKRIESSNAKLEAMRLAKEKAALERALQEGLQEPPQDPSHHSPLTLSLEKNKNASGRAGEPCTVEQAKAAATQAMIPSELGDEWWHNRASTHWTKAGVQGRETAIGETNWRSDLVQWCRAVQAGRTGKTVGKSEAKTGPKLGEPYEFFNIPESEQTPSMRAYAAAANS